MNAPRCHDCGRLRAKPLFFIIEGDNAFPFCHYCIERIFGQGIAKTLGGWEIQLSGDTWLTKVRR
jgi:hypothetical protein